MFAVVIIRFNIFTSMINGASEAGSRNVFSDLFNYCFTIVLTLKATKPSMHADMN